MALLKPCRICGIGLPFDPEGIDRGLCRRCDDVRNDAAIAAMQGMLAHHGIISPELDITRDSVLYADALLAELAKPKENTNV